jgi:hypothetical protein
LELVELSGDSLILMDAVLWSRIEQGRSRRLLDDYAEQAPWYTSAG